MNDTSYPTEEKISTDDIPAMSQEDMDVRINENYRNLKHFKWPLWVKVYMGTAILAALILAYVFLVSGVPFILASGLYIFTILGVWFLRKWSLSLLALFTIIGLGVNAYYYFYLTDNSFAYMLVGEVFNLVLLIYLYTKKEEFY